MRITDQDVLENWGCWENRHPEFLGANSAWTARWAKMHPHIMFRKARYAVWMDSNVIPLRGFKDVFERFRLSGNPVGLIDHPIRHNLLEELEECVRRRKDTVDNLSLARRDCLYRFPQALRRQT